MRARVAAERQHLLPGRIDVGRGDGGGLGRHQVGRAPPHRLDGGQTRQHGLRGEGVTHEGRDGGRLVPELHGSPVTLSWPFDLRRSLPPRHPGSGPVALRSCPAPGSASAADLVEGRALALCARWDYPVFDGGQSHGVGTLRSPHHPEVSTGPDDTWVVRCPECERDRQAPVPIGIGMPVSTRRVAQLLCDNHSGRNILDARPIA